MEREVGTRVALDAGLRAQDAIEFAGRNEASSRAHATTRGGLEADLAANRGRRPRSASRVDPRGPGRLFEGY